MINEVLEALHLQSNQEEEMDKIYDNFQRPPKITTAMQHAMATKFATPDQEIDLDNTNVCPCCGLPTINRELPLCSSRKSFSFNGSGVALYFDFLAYTTIILSIYIIIGSIWNIVDDVQGIRCDLESNSNQLCSKNFNNIFSRANVINDHTSFVIGSALNFCACFTIMISTLYYRRHLNKIAMELDDASILASDYSIVVSNLPRNATEQEIKQYFSQNINDTEIQLRKISMAYEIQSYLQLEKDKIKKENVLTRILEMEAAGKPIPSKIPPRITLEQQIKQISQRLDFLELNKDTSFNFSGVAFLSFNYEKQADIVCQAHTATKFSLILEQFGFPNLSKKFNGNTILVKRAPEPGDIIWGNLGITAWQQEKRVWYTNLITVLLLILALALLFGVSYAQYAIDNSMDQNSLSALAVITILGLFASILISVINIVLGRIIIKFAQSERHSTRTSYDVSVAKKLGIAQFLNTAILTLIVNFVIKDSGEAIIVAIWKIGGLNADLMLIFIINSIVPWLSQLFDPSFFQKMYVRQKIIQEGDKCKYTQQEANEAFEGPKLDLSLKYAQLTKSLMFAFFYAYLLPLGLIFTFLGIICTYWTEKYLLLRRQSKPPPTGSAMAEAMVEFYVELILIIFSIGCCVWEAIIFKELHPLTWAQLAISIFYYLVPIDSFFSCIVQTGIDNATVESYDEKVTTFYDDYDRLNPITKDAAMEAWKKLQQETIVVPQVNQAKKINQIVPV